MVWNALKNLTRYFPNDAKAACCSCPHLCVLSGASLCAVAFLFPWFPWKHCGEGDWLSGLPLVVSLCASDSTLTFVQQAQCVWFVEIFTRHESRLQLIETKQVAAPVGSTSIHFCGLVSDNTGILLNFQAVAAVIATLAAAGLYTGCSTCVTSNPKEAPRTPFSQKVNWSALGPPSSP